MVEELKPEMIKTLSDIDLYTTLMNTTSFMEKLPNDKLAEYKTSNSHYSFTNSNVSLEYFGAQHVFTPNHPQFSNIGNAFESFTEGKEPSKVVVFVEGSIPATTSNIEEDIYSAGERGYITHLAKIKNIEVRCIEPDRIEEVKYLLKHFPPDQIEYYYYLRAVRNYDRSKRIKENTTFELYSEQILNHHKKIYGNLEAFGKYDFSMRSIKNTHRNITGEDFGQNKRLDINPRKPTTIINTISKLSSAFRDFYHVRTIEQALNEGKSVFIVNG